MHSKNKPIVKMLDVPQTLCDRPVWFQVHSYMRDIPHKRKVPEGLSMRQGGTTRERTTMGCDHVPLSDRHILHNELMCL